jgi:hypothetical protein
MLPWSTVLSRVVLILGLCGCEQILGISEPRDFQDAHGVGSIDSPLVTCAQIPTWGGVTNFSAPGSRALAVADLDHDGLRDIVVASQTDVLIFNGSGTGGVGASHPLHSVATPADDLLVVDVDGDGFNDLVTWTVSGVSVHRQSTTMPGTFLAAQSFTTDPIGVAPVATHAVGAGKLDGNTLVDLVVSMMTGTRVYTARVGSPGDYDLGATIGPPNSFVQAVDDLDADGLDDIVISTDQVKIAYNTTSSPGTFSALALVGSPGPFAGAAIGTFSDNAPRKDLVTFAGPDVVLFTQPTSRTFIESTVVPGFSTGARPAVFDLNADGHDDLASDQEFVLQCPQAGQFAQTESFLRLPGGSSTLSQVFEDINANGKPDLLRVNNGPFLEVLLQ